MDKDLYERAKRESAASARRIAFGSPVNWPLPSGEHACDAFERDFWDADDFGDDDD